MSFAPFIYMWSENDTFVQTHNAEHFFLSVPLLLSDIQRHSLSLRGRVGIVAIEGRMERERGREGEGKRKRLPNLHDRSSEFCVYQVVASHLSRPKIHSQHSFCLKFTKPVTAIRLSREEGCPHFFAGNFFWSDGGHFVALDMEVERGESVR